MGNQKSVTDLIEEVREDICNKYCKYAEKGMVSDETIEDICTKCPLNKL